MLKRTMLRSAHSYNQLNRKHIGIWLAMAFQAGAINAGGFIACHRFVTHTTGFATHFGVEASRGETLSALGMLTVPVFFLIGAMLSGFLIDHQLRQSRKPRYDIAFGSIAFTMLAVTTLGHIGLFGVFSEPLLLPRDYVLLALLCLASGIQNATITSSSGAVVRTTHLTGITTDLGIGLVRAAFPIGSQESLETEKKVNRVRMGIILFFMLGSTTSAFLFYTGEYMGFLLPAFISTVLTAFALWQESK